jgi:Family of unknown function (DUF5330)
MPTAGDVGFMFFLLRMAFWLGLVLVLLPTGAAHRSQAGNGINASEAISAASATVGDVREFCTRQPDACTVGSQVATAIGYRAQAGAKMLYDVLSETLAKNEANVPAPAALRHVAGAKAALEKSAAERNSESTLTPGDLTPSWRGPAPHKDAKHPV